MDKEIFNQKKYITDYRKKHKSQFNVDLNVEEKQELEILLKKYSLSKTQFLRNAIELLKDDNYSPLITKKIGNKSN